MWEQVPVPKPHPTGCLIKIIAAGVCRSDHNLLTNENQPSWFKDDFTLGHEGCGRIVQLGESVPRDAGFAVGDIVALCAVPGCGKQECEECSNDLPQLCLTGYRSGIGMDGFFASFCVVDVRGLVHVPKGVSPSQAAVATDAVTTAYHAIHQRGRITAQDIVFLFGLGGLGFNALQVIKAIGAKVLVSDFKQENLDAAVALGIPKEDVVPVGTGIKEWVQQNEWTGRISVVADFVGTAQTFSDAQHIGLLIIHRHSYTLKANKLSVRQAGRILCVGTLNHENTVHMKLGIRKRLDIIFSYGGQTKDLSEVLDLIAQDVLNPMVADGKIEDFPKVMGDLEAGKVQGRIALVLE